MLCSALVLFSGGQDSAACLALDLTQYQRVETVAFDYGQRHRVEFARGLVVLDQIRLGFTDWAVEVARLLVCARAVTKSTSASGPKPTKP